MRKLLLLLVLALVACSHASQPRIAPQVPGAEPVVDVPASVPQEPVPQPITRDKFTCDCELACDDIDFCDRAMYLLNECDCEDLDDDNNGVPCEQDFLWQSAECAPLIK